jgi:hypothetical protein
MSLLGKLYVLKRAILLKINTVLEKYKIKKCNLDFLLAARSQVFGLYIPKIMDLKNVGKICQRCIF